jgi:hypothetical protein
MNITYVIWQSNCGDMHSLFDKIKCHYCVVFHNFNTNNYNK